MTLSASSVLLTKLINNRQKNNAIAASLWTLYSDFNTQGILQNLSSTRVILDYITREDTDILDDFTTAVLAIDGV